MDHLPQQEIEDITFTAAMPQLHTLEKGQRSASKIQRRRTWTRFTLGEDGEYYPLTDSLTWKWISPLVGGGKESSEIGTMPSTSHPRNHVSRSQGAWHRIHKPHKRAFHHRHLPSLWMLQPRILTMRLFPSNEEPNAHMRQVRQDLLRESSYSLPGAQKGHQRRIGEGLNLHPK